jgi:hypothetical protein
MEENAVALGQLRAADAAVVSRSRSGLRGIGLGGPVGVVSHS